MGAQSVVVARSEGANLLVRAIYFLLIGWWLSAIWAVLAWGAMRHRDWLAARPVCSTACPRW